MKKLILAAFALTTAASVFAQGTVFVGNRIAGTPGETTHIWGPTGTAKPTEPLVGFGVNDTTTRTAPATRVDFAAAGLTMVGQPGGLAAATTLVQLLGAQAPSAALLPESSLLPVGGIATFRTQATTAGGIVPITSTMIGIAADATFATLELVAWDNSSGLYSTWALAETAWKGALIAAGKSGAFQVSAIGGNLNNPPNLNNIQDINSFNLYYIIPEPSTFALAGLGAAALLIFRRRK